MLKFSFDLSADSFLVALSASLFCIAHFLHILRLFLLSFLPLLPLSNPFRLQLLSRAALWMFDLCARQIAQVRVFFIAFKAFLLSSPEYDRRL